MKTQRSFTVVLALMVLLLFKLIAPTTSQTGTIILQKLPGSIHDFTGLPLTEDGWTDFEAMIRDGYDDARVVFVSSSEGNDSTGQVYGISDITFDVAGMFQPRSAVNAYKTIAQGYSQIRDGYPDILLLKRGDEWEEAFNVNSVGRWGKSGRSSTERAILGSYGSGARPTLLIGNGTGFVPYYASNLIVSGIRFYSHTWEIETPSRAFNLAISGQSDYLIEDCVAERNVNRLQSFQRVAFRRNHFIEGHPGSLVAKIYVFNGQNLLLEENIFYSPVEKNRHLYLSSPSFGPILGMITKNNIFYTSRRTGLSHRTDGVIDNNLIVRNDQVVVGGAGGSKDEIKSAQVSNNVFLESVPDSAGDGEYSIKLQNNDGTSIYGNIWTDPTGITSSSYAIMISGDTDVHIARNIDIHDNIVYGWHVQGTASRVLSTSSSFTDVQNVNIFDNDFQMTNGGSNIIRHQTWDDGANRFEGYTYSNNRYYGAMPESDWFASFSSFAEWVAASGDTGSETTQVSYTDASRTLKTYNQSLGGSASTEEFMLEALKQARYNWRAEYTACAVNNYIRAGFDKESIECVF